MESLDIDIENSIKLIVQDMKQVIEQLAKIKTKFLCVKAASHMEQQLFILQEYNKSPYFKQQNFNKMQAEIQNFRQKGSEIKEIVHNLLKSEFIKKRDCNQDFSKELENFRDCLFMQYEYLQNLKITFDQFYKDDMRYSWSDICFELDNMIAKSLEYKQKYQIKNDSENHDLAFVIMQEILNEADNKQVEIHEFQQILEQNGLFEHSPIATQIFMKNCLEKKYIPHKITDIKEIINFFNNVYCVPWVKLQQTLNEQQLQPPENNLILKVQQNEKGEELLQSNKKFKMNSYGLYENPQLTQEEQDKKAQEKKEKLAGIVFGRKSEKAKYKCDIEVSSLQDGISRNQFQINCTRTGIYQINCLSMTNSTKILVQNNHFYKLMVGSVLGISKSDNDPIDIPIFLDVMDIKETFAQFKFYKDITKKIGGDPTQTIEVTNQQISVEKQNMGRYKKQYQEGDKTGETTGDTTDLREDANNFLNSNNQYHEEFEDRNYNKDSEEKTKNYEDDISQEGTTLNNKRDDTQEGTTLKNKRDNETENKYNQNNQQNEEESKQQNKEVTSQFQTIQKRYEEIIPQKSQIEEIVKQVKEKSFIKQNKQSADMISIRFRTTSIINYPKHDQILNISEAQSPFIIKLFNPNRFKEYQTNLQKQQQEGKTEFSHDFYIESTVFSGGVKIIIIRFNTNKNQWEITSSDTGPTTSLFYSLMLQDFNDSNFIKTPFDYTLREKDLIKVQKIVFQVDFEKIQK